MDLTQLLFGFQGRIGRQQWWLATLGIYAVIIVLAMVLGLILPEGTFAEDTSPTDSPATIALSVIAIVAYVVIIWSGLALAAKRWHDRDKSAWWILINFVPFVGGIWALIENGFLKGTEGSNRFGSDPLV